MSHYTRVRTQIKDRNCLVKALEDLGFKGKIEIHDEAQQLVGFERDLRPEKANIIIRRKDVGAAANDIGFVLREDGTYEAIISEYDSSSSSAKRNDLTKKCQAFDEYWLKLLNMHYGKHVVTEEARALGYYVSEPTLDEQGNLYLNVENPY